MKFLKILSYFVAICWVLAGLIIIGSLYLGTALWIVHIVVGTLFISIGIYFLQKERCFLELLKSIKDRDKVVQKNILFELILLLFFCFFGLVALSAIYSRVFNEGFSVFG
jgi:hypothetical protein